MYAATLPAMVARIQSVPDIGQVNDYRRHVTTYAAMLATYAATVGGIQQIRAWDCCWESGPLSPDSWLADGRMKLSGHHIYVARGYMSANDEQATDKTFSALLLDVLTALATTAAALIPRESHIPVTLRRNDYLVFEVPAIGPALVHYGEVAIRVYEELAV